MSGYENSRSCVCKAGQSASAMPPRFNCSFPTLKHKHRCAQEWATLQLELCGKLMV